MFLKVDSEPHEEGLQLREEANLVRSDDVSEQQPTIDNCREELEQMMAEQEELEASLVDQQHEVQQQK